MASDHPGQPSASRSSRLTSKAPRGASTSTAARRVGLASQSLAELTLSCFFCSTGEEWSSWDCDVVVHRPMLLHGAH
jgi:hypothetical protein